MANRFLVVGALWALKGSVNRQVAASSVSATGTISVEASFQRQASIAISATPSISVASTGTGGAGRAAFVSATGAISVAASKGGLAAAIINPPAADVGASASKSAGVSVQVEGEGAVRVVEAASTGAGQHSVSVTAKGGIDVSVARTGLQIAVQTVSATGSIAVVATQGVAGESSVSLSAISGIAIQVSRTSSIAEEKQRLTPSPPIWLFQLDATALGGEVYYFTPTTFSKSPVYYDGQKYDPIDIEVRGFEWSGKGALPRPTVRLSNVKKVLSAALVSYDDLIGATVTRIRTFRRFLDDQPSADPNAHFTPDVFEVERKVTANKVFVELELAALADQANRTLGRPILREVCLHRYRRWDADSGAFDYSKATCPYVGAAYFDENGNAVADLSQDRCGKRLDHCQARFGTQPLPTRAFPGVGRVRS